MKRPLVVDEPVEFEKQLVECQDVRKKKITHHFRGIYGICLKLTKKKPTRCQHVSGWTSMKRLLVIDAAVECEKRPVEGQEVRKITDHFRGSMEYTLK